MKDKAYGGKKSDKTPAIKSIKAKPNTPAAKQKVMGMAKGMKKK